MKNPFLWCLAGVLFLISAAHHADAHEIRKWLSKDGTELIEGKFRNSDGTNVTISVSERSFMDFPIDTLSPKDIEYVRNAGVGTPIPVPAPRPQTAQPVIVPQPVSPPRPVVSSGPGQLTNHFKNSLVDRDGRTASLSKTPGGPPKYYILYYSAGWCPPCRKFTPGLVEWSKTARRSHPVEVVLVGSDDSEKDMLKYMNSYQMDFPAIDFEMINSPWVPSSESSGIPALVLVDDNGTRLLSTNEVNRSQFLSKVEELIAK